MVKITTKMFKDWCSPMGYPDFNGGTNHKMFLVEYRGEFAVLREREGQYNGFSVEAKKHLTDAHAKAWRPIWKNTNIPNDFTDYPVRHTMEPDFSLEEISIGEDLIAHQMGLVLEEE